MICQHCGKNVDNELVTYCVYCGYPMKGTKKSYFAAQTEESAAQAAPTPQPAPAPMPAASQYPQNPMPNPGMNPGGAPNPGVNQAMNPGVNPNMQQGAPMPGMNPNPAMAQPMPNPGVNPQQMPNMNQGFNPGMQQGMNQGYNPNPNPAMAQPMPNMNPGMNPMMQQMPQMGYAMPQMGYGMPQFAGYDAAGNPMYFQTVQQFMGYDAYGNPLYSWVNIPYMPQMQMPGMGVMPGMPMPGVMPGMNVMPGVQPQPVQPTPMQLPVVDTNYVDVPEAEAAPETPPQPTPAPAMPQEPVVQQAPAPSPHVASPAPPPAQSVQGAQDAIRAAMAEVMQQPAAKPKKSSAGSRMPSVGAETPLDPQQAQSTRPEAPPIQAMFPLPEKMQQKETATEIPAPVGGSVKIENAEDMPFSADDVMNDAPQQSAQDVPDEETLLNQIFSDAPKNYTMSSGTKPAAMTFSIKVGTDEITSVRDEEAPRPEEPKKRTAKTAADKKEKAEKPEKKPAKKTAKKEPAKIVSPEDFFDDKPRGQKSVLTAADVASMTDEQLEARLAANDAGSKKPRRSSAMKAATEEEMDVSNLSGGIPQ